jgi:hypothetical protein
MESGFETFKRTMAWMIGMDFTEQRAFEAYRPKISINKQKNISRSTFTYRLKSYF